MLMKRRSAMALITNKKFLRHCNNGYMGCEVINGFMSLLEENFNNVGKNNSTLSWIRRFLD
jgi:hypothetical protein